MGHIAAPPRESSPHPASQTQIIQGGMGIAISGWPLANAVARAGELGVVSGTALEVVCARRLQNGDPGGHVQRALDHFPDAGIAQRILRSYFVPGGKAAGSPFKNVPMYTLHPSQALQELTVAANFVEVFLAKEGHDGTVGINYLRKIELPTPFACYGAILAGADYVLMGAGNPKELPELLTLLAGHNDVRLELRVQAIGPTDGHFDVHCSPGEITGGGLPILRRPKFLAIVASVDLAAGLAASPAERPDGFVVEGPSAGGHNAPPRGPHRVDAAGELLYDERDEVDLKAMVDLQIPFWLAGSYGTPGGLRYALDAGASGVQVGTAFALSRESGLDVALKQKILQQVLHGDVRVVTESRASPTGFPFKVVQLDGTLSDQNVYADRKRVCDIGLLRTPYKRADGSIGYRCPAEPTRAYTEAKGGRSQNSEGRKCLCNALLATAGLAQSRSRGYVEQALVTAGKDSSTVEYLMRQLPEGEDDYSAQQVVDHIRCVGAHPAS